MLTTALRDYLDKELTVTGLKIKMYAGYIFSILAGNHILKSEIKNCTARLAPELNEDKFEQLAKIAQAEIPVDNAAGKALINFATAHRKADYFFYFRLLRFPDHAFNFSYA